jgi:hypothetical protein
VAGVVGAVTSWRRRGVLLVLLIALGQVAAVSGWLVGLEVATQRMLVVPVVLAGLLGAVGAAWVWERLSERQRPALVLLAAVLLVVGAFGGWRESRSEAGRTSVERALYTRMTERPECAWVITPRTKLGTRFRHDGCEVIQGIGEARHGRDFWCATWGESPPKDARCVVTATWIGDHYAIADAPAASAPVP